MGTSSVVTVIPLADGTSLAEGFGLPWERECRGLILDPLCHPEALARLFAHCAQDGAVPIKPTEPLKTYELGRMAITVPQSMQLELENTFYTWENQTPDREDALGYPITLREQPYVDPRNRDAELAAAVEKVRSENMDELVLEWDVSQLFGQRAFFLCYEYDGPVYIFHVFLRGDHCLLHLTGKESYRTPAQPEKDARTQGILQALAALYAKYRPGHQTRAGNVFYTYYGEIVDNTINFNETAVVIFQNAVTSFAITADTNPYCGTTQSLEEWMKRAGSKDFMRSQMRAAPHLGPGYERLHSQGNYTELSWDYYGPCRSTRQPSVAMSMVKRMKADMSLYLGAWEVVFENLRPWQEPGPSGGR